jgi:carbonic anhydrase/acetyltransferase-like protein (isoleucine patch superfamily)
MKYSLGEHKVTTRGGDYWIAPNASVIGQVTLEAGASVWFGAVIRGDNDPIVIGEGSNVQENSVLHTDPGYTLRVGRNVTIGHMAMLHGCEVGDNTLIGIGAVVLNGAKIGKNCIVGAKALITEGTEIPDNSLVVGAPGRVIKQVKPEGIADLTRIAEHYVTRWKKFKTEMIEDGE